SEFSGQGEREQEIFSRHPLLKLAFQPVLALEVLTVRTVAVTARVQHRQGVIAPGTACPQPWAARRATDFHGGQRVTVRRQDLVLILIQELGFEGFNDR
ncbi:hypothetical protein MNBD_GAMMA15-1273, partial [hydrothermal vent metagenome]